MRATRTDDFGDDWLRIQIGFVQRQLVSEFGDEIEPDLIVEAVGRGYDRFAGAPVRPFLPMLVSRQARREVRARARGVQHTRPAARLSAPGRGDGSRTG